MITGTVLALTVACPQASVARDAHGATHAGPIVSTKKRRWVRGLIPYSFAPDLPDLLRARVDSAIAQIEAKVFGVTFQPRAGERDYVIFRPAGDCSSEVEGREGGRSVVWLSDSCVTGGVMHELLHVLGFWHEQSRCDRDTYVSIIWSNIEPSKVARDQFEKRCSLSKDLEEYDEASIMHYSDTAFGVKRDSAGALLKTMQSLRGRDSRMGQRDSLSTIDIRTINEMYPPFVPGLSVVYPAGAPTLSWDSTRGALRFSVDLVVQYSEYDEHSTSIVREGLVEGEGYTGLSFVDTQSRYTGKSRCDRHGRSAEYYYDVKAFYRGGSVSSGTRVPAMVAPARPC